MGWSKEQREKAKAAREIKQQRTLALLRQGKTLTDAAMQAGTSDNMIRIWGKKDPIFRQALSQAKAAGAPHRPKNYYGRNYKVRW